MPLEVGWAYNVVIEDGEYFVNFKNKVVESSAILTNMLNQSALMIAGEEEELIRNFPRQ